MGLMIRGCTDSSKLASLLVATQYFKAALDNFDTRPDWAKLPKDLDDLIHYLRHQIQVLDLSSTEATYLNDTKDGDKKPVYDWAPVEGGGRLAFLTVKNRSAMEEEEYQKLQRQAADQMGVPHITSKEYHETRRRSLLTIAVHRKLTQVEADELNYCEMIRKEAAHEAP